MPDFFIKPIFWNPNGYRRPAGFPARTGFPAENGFGHEEWNNADETTFVEDGVRYRVFHTESSKKAQPEAGASFVFLIASHDGVQDLVGIAGNATCLIDEENRRSELSEKLNLHELWRQAWSADTVRDCFENDRAAFLEAWNPGVSWIPNWICPADMYLWLEEPIRLDPVRIIGRQRSIGMFSAFSRINVETALVMLNEIPHDFRSATWRRLESTIASPDADADAEFADIAEIRNRNRVPRTTREALVQARLGQGKFRGDLERRWDGRCAVTGCGLREVLRASHIKPWRSSSDEERLDSNNGLLLVAHIDALFDQGLITFGELGEMIISGRVSSSERERLGIPLALRDELCETEHEYLAQHRRNHGFDG